MHATPDSSVIVVMSTYNGEKHLREQIDSILAQDRQPVSLLVRDDGSTDGTVQILEEYEKQGALELIRGENLGVVGSFISLIARVADSADYIALSDQDDVWHADKLSRALHVLAMHDQAIPQLYCSEYIFCDAEMNPVGASHLNQIGVDFPTMLYENMVSGNTVVINRTLAEVVRDAGREGVYTHDWWLGLLATALGELTYDDFASLDYRRTGSNASPTGTSTANIMRKRIETFFVKNQLKDVTRQLEKLQQLYGAQMSPQKRALLSRFLEGGRVRKALAPVRLRQKPVEELALRAMFLLGML